MKSDQFFSGDQYFSTTNNFTRLKLAPIKNFYQLIFISFLLNKNQIMEILRKPRQKKTPTKISSVFFHRWGIFNTTYFKQKSLIKIFFDLRSSYSEKLIWGVAILLNLKLNFFLFMVILVGSWIFNKLWIFSRNK